MPKIYLEKNVLDAAFERLEFIFNHFDNIYFRSLAFARLFLYNRNSRRKGSTDKKGAIL